MTRYVNLLFVALCAVAAAGGLSPAPARSAEHTKQDEAKTTGAMAPSATRGKKVWGENCARCHEMRDPKDLTDREWPAVIRHMRVRGGLTGQEERDLFELFIKGNN